MPRTRSRTNGAINGISALQGNVSDDGPLEREEVSIDAIKTYLVKAGRGVNQLQKQLEESRLENERLSNELKALSDENKSPRKLRFKQQDIIRIHKLEEKVKELKALNRKNQRRIDMLQSKEVQEEAKELEQDGEKVALGDSGYRMRKLLRRFNDLMLVVTLGDEETCPICWDGLELNKCSSLPCEHLICDTCLAGVSQGSDETVECAMCRKRWERDDVMNVYMSETARWDALINVAQAFSAMDKRGEEETSEEENEEDFIDDRSEAETASGPQERVGSSSELSELTEESELGTPERTTNRSFSESPTKDKRKRLERLAEERISKRSRM